jgi:outer membrane protein TolC
MKYISEVCKLLCISFFLLTSGVHAQSLSLQEFVTRVKAENVALKISSTAIDLAKEDSKIARSTVLPNVEISGNFRRDLNKNYLFINDPSGGLVRLRTNFNNSVNASAVLNQTLFNAKIFDALKLVKLSEELTVLNHLNQVKDIEANASTMYWQAVLLKESVNVLNENSLLAKSQYEQLQKLFDKGVASQLELQKFEILYKKTIPELHRTKNKYAAILNELKLIANIDLSSDLQLGDDLKTLHEALNFSQLKVEIDNQTQLKILEKEVEISEKEINAKRKFWFPKLDLVAAYDFNSQDNNFRFNKNKNKLFFAQIGINIPIFSGGKHKAEINKARIKKDIAEQNYLQTKSVLHKNLENAIHNYNTAVDNIQLYRETVVLALKELNILEKQLQLGVITSTDLKESRVRLKQAKLDELNSYLDLHIAKIQIQRITTANQ